MFQDNIHEIKRQNGLELLPLQEYALEELRKAFRKSKKIILQAGCGFGKTVIAAQIAKNALLRGKKVLFIADRIVLCNQTSDVFLRYGIPHGVIQAHNPRFDINQPCQVCSIQTLKLRGCPAADVIIIDECHVLFEEHIRIMQENSNAYILGLSASPYTKGLGKYFDFHIQPVPVKKLIEEGYLVPFDVYGPSIADLSKLKIQAGEYTEQSLSEAYDKADILGDVVKTWQKLTPGRKTIVFGVNVAHIKHLKEQFIRAGISACEINAYQTEEERQEALDGFRLRNTTVLCSVEVATKGFDHAAVEVAVLAVATRSMIKWTQTTGRALRTYPGKERAVILDLGGNCERLGFPDDYEFFGLDDGKKKKAAEEQKKERLPKVCPSCDFLKPIGVRECPACGFTPEFKKDVEVGDAELSKLQRKTRKDYTIEQKQNWLAQLNSYAAERNMKRGRNGCYGWALYAYKEKFGSWPSGKIDWAKREPIGREVGGFITHKNIKYANRKDA
jgi:superfamily II DNA or RNA helicase